MRVLSSKLGNTKSGGESSAGEDSLLKALRYLSLCPGSDSWPGEFAISDRPFSVIPGASSLSCGPVSLEKLARRHGTPLYVYSATRSPSGWRCSPAAFHPLRPLDLLFGQGQLGAGHSAVDRPSGRGIRHRLRRRAGKGVDARKRSRPTGRFFRRGEDGGGDGPRVALRHSHL